MKNEVLAERIKQHRKINGFSQEQLAQNSGLNLRTIQRIENGETVPRGDSLRRLAQALHTSPDELIDWQASNDQNVLMVMILSQLSFLAFPC
ncbi:MAG: helix-turn-helix transcriptional regulator [Cyclobacteriaceae bacterium]